MVSSSSAAGHRRTRAELGRGPADDGGQRSDDRERHRHRDRGRGRRPGRSDAEHLRRGRGRQGDRRVPSHRHREHGGVRGHRHRWCRHPRRQGTGGRGPSSDGAPPTTEDSARTIASGTDIEIEGEGGGLAGQTLNISVEEEDGKVTGEFRVTDIVNTVECVDTDTDGVVILGGRAPEDAGPGLSGELIALAIRDGDPDGVLLYGNDVGATSCTELVESIPDTDLSEDGP